MQGVLSFCLLLGLLPAVSAPQPALSREQAWEMVRARQEIAAQKDVRVFVAPEPLASGTVIRTWHKSVTVPAAMKQAWFFFIDLAPQANWEHDCLYVFVALCGGAYEVLPGRLPPDMLAQMVCVFPPDS